jgi:hypothetical protein
MLGGIDLQLVTNISNQSVSPIFKFHAAFLDCLTTEDRTELLDCSVTSVTRCQPLPCSITDEKRPKFLIHLFVPIAPKKVKI